MYNHHIKLGERDCMMYGYARCSTNEGKQDIDRQKRELKSLGVDDNNIYFEYESGTKTDRVQFNRLLLPLTLDPQKKA
jgi:DNA invertase Pin-like site-specific DNA recombinase